MGELQTRTRHRPEDKRLPKTAAITHWRSVPVVAADNMKQWKIRIGQDTASVPVTITPNGEKHIVK
ncbi:MAG TPA: hypothetical protein VFN35_03430 [Ktedonobacteraceae bacterium]|nr:hypothetical protein [Ktedonobacteraceae bacterium]